MINDHSSGKYRLLRWLASLVLALIMVCSLATSALAAEENDVTETEPNTATEITEPTETPIISPADDNDVPEPDGESDDIVEIRGDPDGRASYESNAAIYYLATPDGYPASNDTQYWAPASDKSTLLGKINTRGANWVNNKNIMERVSDYITSWPDDTKGSTWTVKRGDASTGSYFTYILDSIWGSYSEKIRMDTGVSDLQKEDVTEITLAPFKISQNNSSTVNQYYHIDCTISIVCSKVFTGKFWVKNPGADEYTQIDAKNYKNGSTVAETNKSIEKTKIVDGITYVFDGWYAENSEGNAYGDKVENWDYTPKELDLADGTVNFYAHYTPACTSVRVSKKVSGNMSDKTKVFHFSYKINGGAETSFTLANGDTYNIENISVGATLIVTEDGYGDGTNSYTASYTVDGTEEIYSGTATISNIQAAANGHTIAFTNTKNAVPDTGLSLDALPYILMFTFVAAGAIVLVLRKKRNIS